MPSAEVVQYNGVEPLSRKKMKDMKMSENREREERKAVRKQVDQKHKHNYSDVLYFTFETF